MKNIILLLAISALTTSCSARIKAAYALEAEGEAHYKNEAPFSLAD